MRSRRLCVAVTVACLAFAADAAVPPVLVIHGGAGAVRRDMTPARESAVRAALLLALTRGYAQLKAGRPALDAVTSAITVLEDDPNFNAGKGAAFTHDGSHSMDAAIMDGTSLQAGAVVEVQDVRNPIALARAVMEHSPHVMLSGAGAEAFARSQGMTPVGPAYFRTDARWQEWQNALKKDAAGSASADVEASGFFGSVGAVALDARGHLAAGTSNGGMTNNRWGRIGATPIIGAGTYANGGCAVSAAGWDEFYLRTVAAHEICMEVTRMRVPIKRAAAEVINQEIPSMGGSGGAIALDSEGNISIPFNTDGMYRGWIAADGVAHVAIYGEEDDGSAEVPAPQSPDDDQQP